MHQQSYGTIAGDVNRKVGFFSLVFMVFLGAGLLFSLEPLVGRLLIPHFGGAAHVWLACLMFFQAMLLLGYLYAHLLVHRLGFWHVILLLVPMLNLPLQLSANPDPHAPLLSVLGILVLRVALPFIALSTTAVVAQTWFSRSPLVHNTEPYFLYAASNAGSLVALLGYAFLMEPLVGITAQSIIWSAAYSVYVVIVIITWFRVRPEKGSIAPLLDRGPMDRKPQVASSYLPWLLLSGLPSALLLALTNYMALEIGSFPFIWVIPLALYLGSFILTFRTGGGIPRMLKVFWLEVLVAGLALYSFGPRKGIFLLAHLATFFGICLIAHGHLYTRRPSPRYLTNFYLTMAFGGWIGGVLISLVAPFVFSGLFEYPILLVLFGLVFWRYRDPLFCLPIPARLVTIGLMVFAMLTFSWRQSNENTLFLHRNFYGTYRIIDESAGNRTVRKLAHGSTLHGAQFTHPAMHSEPISYYYKGGPIFNVYELIASPRRMGVVGLGAGTLSAYARRDDFLTYYEIDPDNEKIARRWFSYLNECQGTVKVVVGDGRLSMQSQSTDNGRYDLILIDAFTGDGIPTHLLTKEAIQVYLGRLSNRGLLLFHISNRYYDLRSVMKANAESLGLFGVMNRQDTSKKNDPYRIDGQCVVLTREREHFLALLSNGWVAFGQGDGLENVAPWSDDHINILSPLMSGLSRYTRLAHAPLATNVAHARLAPYRKN